MRGHRATCKSFKRYTDANAWVTQEEAKIQQGLYLELSEARKHTFSDTVTRILAEEPLPSNRVAQLKEWQAAIGDGFLSAVTEQRIDEIATAWRTKGPVKRPLSPATVNRYLNALSLLFEAARRWGWVRKNPVRDVRKLKEPTGRVRYLSAAERTALLEACRKSSYRPLELVVLLALSTGMRRGELMSLRWEQVDATAGIIVLLKTKNGTQRRVYVRGRALELLREYSKERRIDTDYLFPGERASPSHAKSTRKISERYFNIRRPYLRALKAAGIQNFRFHDLRHACASFLAMNGATPLEIAEVLGHKSLEVTKRYAHLSDTHVAGVVESMNRRFLGGGEHG